jgi:prophage tail gpP-like protein
VADVRLAVNGMEFLGWKEVRIERSVDSISGVFDLRVSDKWSADAEAWVIKAGSECVISVDAVVVMTGYVDVVKPAFDASSRSLQVAGRDRSADMVDSSALNEPDSWSDITIGKLATELARPFGITVVDESAEAQTIRAKIQPGETAFAMLERYSRQLGILKISDGKGGILITKPGQRRADVALEQGKNILKASGTSDHSQRFFEYLVAGQTAGTDDQSGHDAAQVEGKARDTDIRGVRRLLIIAPNSANAADMQAIAAWEAIVRAARGSPLTITVQGWYQSLGGRLWQPGEIVQVRSTWLQLFEPADFLINAVKFSKSDDEGTVTELELLRPDAYKPKPEVASQMNAFGGKLDG